MHTPELKPYMGEAGIQAPLTDSEGTTKWFITGIALKSVEINLLAAHKDQLDKGLDVYGTRVIVKAYHQTHQTNGQMGSMAGVVSRTTFSHASTDYGYRNTIQDAIGHGDHRLPMTEMERPYWGKQPWVVIQKDGTLTRTHHQ
jgi:hypothetical protein